MFGMPRWMGERLVYLSRTPMFHLIRRKQFSQKIAFATFPCIGEGSFCRMKLLRPQERQPGGYKPEDIGWTGAKPAGAYSSQCFCIGRRG